MINAVLHAEITQRVHRLWRGVERFEYADVISLLSPTCRWNRAGRWRDGHAEILASLEERPRDRLVRHLIGSLAVDSEGAELVCRYTLSSVHNGAAPEAAAPFSTIGQRLLGDCTDRLVQINGTWLFENLDAELLFLAKG